MATTKVLQYSGLSYFWSKIKAKLQAVIGDTESYSVATSAWSAASGVDPFGYKATISAKHVITSGTVVELYNTSAVDFANYGFAIASISGQTITIYALDKPTKTLGLTINYKEAV